MPIQNGKYVSPGWVNGSTPALNAAELNAISTRLAAIDADDPRGISTGGTGGATADAAIDALFGALTSGSTIDGSDIIAVNDVSEHSGMGVTFSDFLAALNAAGLPLIETGSYTGAGTYGSANDCSITLSTVTNPKAVFVRPATGSYNLVFIRPDQLASNSYTYGGGMASGTSYGTSNSPEWARFSGSTLYWYNSNDANQQLNTSGTAYYWVAIG